MLFTSLSTCFDNTLLFCTPKCTSLLHARKIIQYKLYYVKQFFIFFYFIQFLLTVLGQPKHHQS
nr:MAG TPA_asm: hypothetical protein [Caudoviricetes sp.]